MGVERDRRIEEWRSGLGELAPQIGTHGIVARYPAILRRSHCLETGSPAFGYVEKQSFLLICVARVPLGGWWAFNPMVYMSDETRHIDTVGIPQRQYRLVVDGVTSISKLECEIMPAFEIARPVMATIRVSKTFYAKSLEEGTYCIPNSIPPRTNVTWNAATTGLRSGSASGEPSSQIMYGSGL